MNQMLFNQALAAHQRGDLTGAEAQYQALLAQDADAPAPLQMLGMLRAQQGRNEEALDLIGRALKIQPNVPEILLNYGNVLKSMRRHAEAYKAYTKAVGLRPDFAGAWYNRGNCQQEMKRTGAAVEDYDRALALNPNHEMTLVNRGNALHELRREPEALESFDRALAINPNRVDTWKNRGITLRVLERFPEAMQSFDRALALKPGDPELLGCRGHTLTEMNRLEEAFAVFRDAATREIGKGTPYPPDTPPHKLRHDAEQQEWLGARARVDGPLFLDGGARLSGPAINPMNAEKVTRAWNQSNPQLVVIDDLLTPEALASLRKLCLGSNVWRRVYSDGYLGAFPEQGFAAPLLAQIAEEFASTYPAIFQDHPLGYLWAFKYDSTMRGINVHADGAAVNVNFWITPDEANLDPDHGGLVVWDKAAPLDWNFESYNGNVEGARAFLEKSGAQSVTVPYRANRAVVFDSDLFHETDTIAFKDGYENRRINVTLLYGRR